MCQPSTVHLQTRHLETEIKPEAVNKNRYYFTQPISSRQQIADAVADSTLELKLKYYAEEMKWKECRLASVEII